MNKVGVGVTLGIWKLVCNSEVCIFLQNSKLRGTSTTLDFEPSNVENLYLILHSLCNVNVVPGNTWQYMLLHTCPVYSTVFSILLYYT